MPFTVLTVKVDLTRGQLLLLLIFFNKSLTLPKTYFKFDVHHNKLFVCSEHTINSKYVHTTVGVYGINSIESKQA